MKIFTIFVLLWACCLTGCDSKTKTKEADFMGIWKGEVIMVIRKGEVIRAGDTDGMYAEMIINHKLSGKIVFDLKKSFKIDGKLTDEILSFSFPLPNDDEIEIYQGCSEANTFCESTLSPDLKSLSLNCKVYACGKLYWEYEGVLAK